tara:strand:+ start:597 stop:950 length:354 start_codon:yes stop_codon:yes gene_type:complete
VVLSDGDNAVELVSPVQPLASPHGPAHTPPHTTPSACKRLAYIAAIIAQVLAPMTKRSSLNTSLQSPVFRRRKLEQPKMKRDDMDEHTQNNSMGKVGSHRIRWKFGEKKMDDVFRTD